MKFTLKSHRWAQVSVVLLLLFTGVYGQGVTVSGRAYDDAENKFGPVRITLYDLEKQKVGELETGNNGKFKFKKISPGNYTMNLYGDGGFHGTKNVSVAQINITELAPTLSLSENQPQITTTPLVSKVEIKWNPIPNTVGYRVFRDNEEVGKVKKSIYYDEIKGGKTYAYTVSAVDKNSKEGPRSITEYGKVKLPAPEKLRTIAKKNVVKLLWKNDPNATSYNVYRDGKLVNTTSDPNYTDFKLKWDRDYTYTVASTDHDGDEGSRSSGASARTHKEVISPRGLNAESGESQVTLTWKPVNVATKYYIYMNGELIDSTTALTKSIETEPGTENCFSVSANDKYGTEGPKSKPACDKSVYSPPDTIKLTGQLNKILVQWSEVEGASTYNVYRNRSLVTNSENLKYLDKGLKWDKEYKYHLVSLTEEGVEGPESDKYTFKTPPIFVLEGRLMDENGSPDSVDQAKVFLYAKGSKLKDEFNVERNGKFRFEKKIVPGEYTIKAYGNGSGNGGIRFNVVNKDLKDLKVHLSTDSLRPEISVDRGIAQLTVNWNDFPQVQSYNIYKNNRKIGNVNDTTSYTDDVAPGSPVTFDVRTVDIYGLEGPKSNKVSKKSSYVYPELIPTVVAGGYTEELSGRHIKLVWQPVAGVDNYALYRDGKLLLKLSETSYLDSVLDYNTEYIYEINSIDADGLEGLNCPIIPVKTHEKVTKPILVVKSKINAIELDWTLVDPAINYKIYRNGNYMADTKNLNFIDNVQPGDEFCYTISAEDTFQTVGIQAEVQCIKAWFAPPANFKGTMNRNQISLSWTAVMGASGYHLYQNDELIFTTEDGTEYLDSTLTFDQPYVYEIASFDKDGDDGPKVEVNLRTHEEVLAISMDAEADLKKISLNWKKSNLWVDHRYRIYRDTQLIKETSDTTFQDFTPPGRYFCYSVTVIDKYGTESEKSNEECHKVLVNYPKDLSVTGDVKRVLFNWRKTIGADHYIIYAMDKETDSVVYLTKTKGNYYEHKDLEFDAEYCYKVSCVDNDGDEGPASPTLCSWVLPPPHISLIEKSFVEGSNNNLLDGREHAWIIVKIVNDGRSPAREMKPWLEPIGDSMTPSLKIDSVSMIPILDVGDTLTIHFSIYAKLKIESGERNFNIRIEEYTGMDLDPEPISFTTLKVIPPNFVISDFAVDNEWGQHYIPKNETVTLTIRFQNLSEGKSDSATLRLRRDSSFTVIDEDEFYQFGFVNAGEYYDFSFEVMSREDRFSVFFDIYDYFETRKTIPIHLETMKKYKGASALEAFETPYPAEVTTGFPTTDHELAVGIPKVSVDRGIIGIVLGNQKFWDPGISGRSLTNENVKIVRDYFHDLYGLDDYAILPSQYWFFNDGISSKDFQAIFDPDLGYIKKKIETSLEYAGQKSLDLILYFSGEGTTINGEKCLIPYDADPKNDYSFYSVNEMYKNLARLQEMPSVGEITLFMDVDFNNPAFDQNIVKVVKEEDDPKSKKKKKKKKKGKPEEPIVKLPMEIKPPEGITAFYASNTTQITYKHPDMDNGIFTYYLLRGMKGEADNGDKEVTVAELHDYISKHVQDTTSKLYQDLPQVPQLFTSNPDRVLYRLP